MVSSNPNSDVPPNSQRIRHVTIDVTRREWANRNGLCGYIAIDKSCAPSRYIINARLAAVGVSVHGENREAMEHALSVAFDVVRARSLAPELDAMPSCKAEHTICVDVRGGFIVTVSCADAEIRSAVGDAAAFALLNRYQ